MKSVYGFVIKPFGQRYNNSKEVDGNTLITNTEMFNHQFVNKLATVTSCPMSGDDLGIKPGDVVMVHHNVFRRWEDQQGRERNSKNFFDENTYIVYADQIFLIKSNDEWRPTPGYCFVKPIKSRDIYSEGKEKPLVGIVKYPDKGFSKEDLVGFKPGSEYEFIVEGQRLYRVLSKFISIQYEYQGDEEEYNPSWA